VAPPFRFTEVDLMHDRGISREGDLIDLAMEDKLIDKSGSWINYGDIRLGQGRENAKQYLRDNPALVEEITRKVLEKRGLTGTPPKDEDNSESGAKPEAARKELAGRKQPAATE
jgi:recombination protein RecA